MQKGDEGFAATRVMGYSELPPARIRSVGFAFLACGCAHPRLARAPRSWWMFFWPGARLYKCARCGTKVLRRRLLEREDLWRIERPRQARRMPSAGAAVAAPQPVLRVAIEVSGSPRPAAVEIVGERAVRPAMQAANSRAYD